MLKTFIQIAAIAFFAVIAEGNRGKQAKSQSSTSRGRAAYREWRKVHRLGSEKDSVNYETRLAIFSKERERVEAHNARSDVSWKETLNHLADYTPQEFQALLGYHRHSSRFEGRGGSWSRASSSSFLEVQPDLKPDVSNFAKSVDWRKNSKVATQIKNQGGCGSCWAVASAAALESYAEMYMKGMAPTAGSAPSLLQKNDGDDFNKDVSLSVAQLVDCTENKDHCGGNGGCKGATAELAFNYTLTSGLLHISRDYQGDGRWDGDLKKKDHCAANTVPAMALLQESLLDEGSETGPEYIQEPIGITIDRYVTLPINKVMPLYDAIQNIGPVVISADATNWGPYGGGVFAGCKPDTVVNHAVVLMGYGVENNQKYWLIRNSWTATWGEAGYMKLLRVDGDIDSPKLGYCGKDDNNQEGIGCENDAKVITVCGVCGMYLDSAYPVGVKVVFGKRLPAPPPRTMTIVSSSSASTIYSSSEVRLVQLERPLVPMFPTFSQP